MKLKKQKKGIFNNVANLMIGLAGLVIIVAVTFLMIANVAANSQVAADGNASAAVETIRDSAADIPDWIPIIVVASIGLILFGLIAMYRMGR